MRSHRAIRVAADQKSRVPELLRNTANERTCRLKCIMELRLAMTRLREIHGHYRDGRVLAQGHSTSMLTETPPANLRSQRRMHDNCSREVAAVTDHGVTMRPSKISPNGARGSCRSGGAKSGGIERSRPRIPRSRRAKIIAFALPDGYIELLYCTNVPRIIMS